MSQVDEAGAVPVLTRRAAIAAALMAGAAVAGQAMVPTKKMAASRANFRLDTLVPTTFADWKVDTTVAGAIVNPQTEEILNRLYSQLLDRTYVNGKGQHIMVSVAYGEDQSDNSVQMHYPEVCYPAQGFQLREMHKDVIALPQGPLRVKRLDTMFGHARPEPVTYWTIVGDRQSLGSWDKKRSEIIHAFHGEIIDGLLFRISSIDPDKTAAYGAQDAFVRELAKALTPDARRQLLGLA